MLLQLLTSSNESSTIGAVDDAAAADPSEDSNFVLADYLPADEIASDHQPAEGSEPEISQSGGPSRADEVTAGTLLTSHIEKWTGVTSRFSAGAPTGSAPSKTGPAQVSNPDRPAEHTPSPTPTGILPTADDRPLPRINPAERQAASHPPAESIASQVLPSTDSQPQGRSSEPSSAAEYALAARPLVAESFALASHVGPSGFADTTTFTAGHFPPSDDGPLAGPILQAMAVGSSSDTPLNTAKRESARPRAGAARVGSVLPGDAEVVARNNPSAGQVHNHGTTGRLQALELTLSAPADAAPTNPPEGTFSTSTEASRPAALPELRPPGAAGPAAATELLQDTPPLPAQAAQETRGSPTDPAAIRFRSSAVNPPEIARQIGDIMVTSRNEVVEISLAPEELGKLRMILSGTERAPHLTIWAERPEVLDQLRRQSDALLREFHEQGLEDATLDFRDGNQVDPRANAPEDEPAMDAALSGPATPSRTYFAGNGRHVAASAGIDIRV